MARTVQMILGDPTTDSATTTLDDIFRRAAARRPDAIALADPPNRESFTDGPPRRLTYTEADRIVSAIASRLRNLGLQTDAVVAIQLPNTVECVLTLLGVLRAGMIAAPLPLLWRHYDAAQALGRIGAKAIITASRIGDCNAAAIAVQIAADVFTIRQVCAFGQNLPDGVIAFDDLLDRPEAEPPAEMERSGNAAAHVAVVTFDVTPDGHVPVARNHAQLIAGGLATLLEGCIAPDSRLLACCGSGSFAGLALTVLPWLLSGGTLLLHHSFEPDAFTAQYIEYGCENVVVPGPLLPDLTDAGLLAHAELKNVLAVWRTPERQMASAAWQPTGAVVTDMLVFGEIALIGSRRGGDGLPVALPAQTVAAPRHSAHALPVADIARTPHGTLALRGPMVPRHAFLLGSAHEDSPSLKADAEGFVDTGYACRIDPIAGTVTLSGPPPGIISVGGYRFVLSELEHLVQRADNGAFVTALPDTVAGHRLAGVSGNIRTALTELGVNPLIADAFRAA